MPSTAYAPPKLLSERTLVRWMRGSKPSPTIERERHFRERVQAVMGDDAAREFDDITGETELQAQDRVLLFVGTILVQNNQRRLWNLIFATVNEGETEGGELRFLEDSTAAVRRGEF